MYQLTVPRFNSVLYNVRMDPQAPNTQPSSFGVHSVHETPQKNKDGRTISVLAMAIFVLLALGTIVFLYNQNQQLKSMLAKYQMPTSSPTPITVASPAATPDTTGWKTYLSSGGKYTFEYPSGYKINENKVVGVDGVSSPTPNTVQVISSVLEGTNGNFAMAITHKNTSSNLQAFISANTGCSSVTSTSGTAYKIGTVEGSIFRDTPCGPRGATYLYFINNGVGYMVTVESTVDSKTTELYSDQILSTFQFIAPTPSPLAIPSNIPVPINTSPAIPNGY